MFPPGFCQERGKKNHKHFRNSGQNFPKKKSIKKFWSFWAEGVLIVKYTESLEHFSQNPAENRAQKWDFRGSLLCLVSGLKNSPGNLFGNSSLGLLQKPSLDKVLPKQSGMDWQGCSYRLTVSTAPVLVNVAAAAPGGQSRGIERDKLKGTNGAKWAAVRRFLLIFAFFLGITAFWRCRFSQKTCRKPQVCAENRRFPQKPVLIPPCRELSNRGN